MDFRLRWWIMQWCWGDVGREFIGSSAFIRDGNKKLSYTEALAASSLRQREYLLQCVSALITRRWPRFERRHMFTILWYKALWELYVRCSGKGFSTHPLCRDENRGERKPPNTPTDATFKGCWERSRFSIDREKSASLQIRCVDICWMNISLLCYIFPEYRCWMQGGKRAVELQHDTKSP